MNITGTLSRTGNLKPNLKTSPSLFTHAKSAHQSILIKHTGLEAQTRVSEGQDLASRKRYTVGSLSEGTVALQIYSFQWLNINGRHLGFTILIGRMTEVLAPDIYMELTAPHIHVPCIMLCICKWELNDLAEECFWGYSTAAVCGSKLQRLDGENYCHNGNVCITTAMLVSLSAWHQLYRWVSGNINWLIKTKMFYGKSVPSRAMVIVCGEPLCHIDSPLTAVSMHD